MATVGPNVRNICPKYLAGRWLCCRGRSADRRLAANEEPPLKKQKKKWKKQQQQSKKKHLHDYWHFFSAAFFFDIPFSFSFRVVSSFSFEPRNVEIKKKGIIFFLKREKKKNAHLSEGKKRKTTKKLFLIFIYFCKWFKPRFFAIGSNDFSKQVDWCFIGFDRLLFPSIVFPQIDRYRRYQKSVTSEIFLGFEIDGNTIHRGVPSFLIRRPISTSSKTNFLCGRQNGLVVSVPFFLLFFFFTEFCVAQRRFIGPNWLRPLNTRKTGSRFWGI